MLRFRRFSNFFAFLFQKLKKKEKKTLEHAIKCTNTEHVNSHSLCNAHKKTLLIQWWRFSIKYTPSLLVSATIRLWMQHTCHLFMLYSPQSFRSAYFRQIVNILLTFQLIVHIAFQPRWAMGSIDWKPIKFVWRNLRIANGTNRKINILKILLRKYSKCCSETAYLFIPTPLRIHSFVLVYKCHERRVSSSILFPRSCTFGIVFCNILWKQWPEGVEHFYFHFE